MQKMNYSLIVTDFDGTLLKSDGTISQRTKDAINRYVAKGGKFAISTGRMPAAILPHIKELGLDGVVSCAQGSIIIDIQTNEILASGTIPNDIAVKVCQSMEKRGLHIHVYDLWEYYSNMNDSYLAYYESLVKTKAILVQNEPISAFIKRKGINPFKILVMLEPEDNERIRLELENEKFQNCEVTRSASWLVEVGNVAYNKGTSVQFLANYYGIPMQQTIAIGDQLNDLAMIETAALGFAVQNADDSLKKFAIVLPQTNDDDAVAEVIERYGYTEE